MEREVLVDDKLKYRIRIWIPIEPEEDLLFDSWNEAISEKEHLKLLQPENIYELEVVEDD